MFDPGRTLDTWSPTFFHHQDEAQRGKDTCLQSHSTSAEGLGRSCCPSPPTCSRRNQHLCYPEASLRPSQWGPWSPQIFAKWTGQKGEVTPLSWGFVLFFKQKDNMQGRDSVGRRHKDNENETSLASEHTHPWPGREWLPFLCSQPSLRTDSRTPDKVLRDTDSGCHSVQIMP